MVSPMVVPDEVGKAIRLSISATAKWFNENVQAVNAKHGDGQFDTCLSICGEKYVHYHLFEELTGHLPSPWKPFREVGTGQEPGAHREPRVDLAVSRDRNPERDRSRTAAIEVKVGYLPFDSYDRDPMVPEGWDRDTRKYPSDFRSAAASDRVKLRRFGVGYLVVLGYYAWKDPPEDHDWWAEREAEYEDAVASLRGSDLSIWWNRGFL